ncbi:MAG: hypothetical protein MUP47_02200 [Phycisphaerae bacterium]|nr:hypothetical protein [Phycisphaerae bacterium]
MKTFTTTDPDRLWNVAIDVNALRRLRAAVHVDLMEAIQGDLLDKLAADPVLLVDVLWVLCREQAEAAGITDEQFGGAVIGDVIEAATDALLEELADFFPQRRRKVLRMAKEKAAKLQELNLAQAAELLGSDLMETRLLAEHERLRARIAGGSSTSAPGSSELTPAP